MVGVDQTGWKRLKGGGKAYQVWGLTSPDIAYYRIAESKKAEVFVALMQGISVVGDDDRQPSLGDNVEPREVEIPRSIEGRIAVCDMASTHLAGVPKIPGLELAGCWAHVFRRFRDASEDHPEALTAMHLIGDLYEIDAMTRSDAERAEARNDRSRAKLKELRRWYESIRVPAKTSLGGAIRYLDGHWQYLTRFVEDAHIPLDNNACERALRGPVVGRKNHHGSRSRRGTEVAAICYSRVETAKLFRVDPRTYLVEAVLSARRGEVLLPHDYVSR